MIYHLWQVVIAIIISFWSGVILGAWLGGSNGR